MARLSVADPRIRRLVEKLVPLVIESQSVNNLCERLNAALATEHVTVPIYPNRLHSLLSDDPSRGLNEATVALVERAVAALPAADHIDTQDSASQDAIAKLLARVQEAWRASNRSSEAIADVAESLALPAAIVRHLLQRAGELPKREATSPVLTSPEAKKEQTKSLQPDWSFQDTAVGRCLDSLSASATRKIGLVLPTGGGKTRVALRVALSFLSRYPSATGPVLWVTHRRNLRTQAHRELQKMLSAGVQDLPQNSAELLARRVEFIMVSELPGKLADRDRQPLLVIVDEAHHAAAASYKPIFEVSFSVRGLFLTATPNRTDELPIGIDEIAYTTTYRELAERGVILLPEFEDFPVPDFDWSEESVQDLADKIITRSAEDYRKVLVIAPRIDRVEEFHAALLRRLSLEDSHPLAAEDIGFVHSTGNSLRILDAEGNLIKASAEEFLSHFTAKPRAIIVSAQMLLEGFDDPELNAVVITYPSSSTIVLMQAAGRCVRYAPGKTFAFVLQARNDSIAYHFDQRWLYQEISDYLRPQLIDADYSSLPDLKNVLGALLKQHNISTKVQERIITSLDQLMPGERCRVLLSGLPYYEQPSSFHQQAEWSALLETSKTTAGFRDIFNTFCALGADLSDPSDFLRKSAARYGIFPDFLEGSEWRTYADMLTAMYFAHSEVYEDGSRTPEGVSRPFLPHGPSTWLKYATFHYRPVVSPELVAFLQDCYNREALIAEYQRDRAAYRMVVKVPLPLGGNEGFLFSLDQAGSFQATVETLRSALKAVAPERQFAELASRIAQLVAAPIPLAVLTRLERFMSDAGYSQFVLPLSLNDPSPGLQASPEQFKSQPTEDAPNA